MSKMEYQEIIAFHPGYYIKDLLEQENMSQEELAKRLDTTPKTVSELINGLIPLSGDMARRLSYVFDTSISMWLNLQSAYEEKKQEIERRRHLEEEAITLKKLKYSYWVKLKMVKETKKNEEKVEELQRFLGIASLSSLGKKEHLVMFRQGGEESDEKSLINANAWVRTALKVAEKTETSPYDEKGLKEAISEMRSLTKTDPGYFVQRLKEILSSNGVALVLLPYLEGSRMHGAVSWLTHDKAMIALSDRLKHADVFWFSFFHELGHVFQRKLKTLSVSADSPRSLSEKEEKMEEEADSFARDTLIHSKMYEAFIKTGRYEDRERILAFAEQLDIDPGIVVGRLEKEGLLPYGTPLDELKKRYEIL